MTSNRIREWREKRGLTGAELADLVGTTQTQISKIERGARSLTVEWMMRLSKALAVPPEELLPRLAFASFQEDARPYIAEKRDPVGAALAAQNQMLYTSQSDALSNLDIQPDTPLLFNMSKEACENIRTGDIVLVQVMDKSERLDAITIVRQFMQPDLLITNRHGVNQSFHLIEQEFTCQIRGVHRLDDAKASAH